MNTSHIELLRALVLYSVHLELPVCVLYICFLLDNKRCCVDSGNACGAMGGQILIAST